MEEMNNRPHKPITNTQISYMCLIFLLLVGQESAFGGWISSFAVMSGFSTKEGATVYSSMYWGFVTLFRFLLPFVEGKSSIKLLLLFTLAIVGSLFSLAILHTIDPIVGMALSGIFLGISNSIAFPQTLTLPH